MFASNENNERCTSCPRKTINLLLAFFMVLFLALLISIIFLVVHEDTAEEVKLYKSKTKRSLCIDRNCDIEYSQLEMEINCPPATDQNLICLTKDCTLTAATLISAMDPSVDPCDDFYAFSCANFIRNNLVPEEKNRMTTFLQYEDQHNLRKKNVIENYNPYGEPDVVFRLQEAYHVCINASYDREKELTALKNYVTNVLDGWPMAVGEEWKPKRERLEDYFADLILANIQDSIIYVDETIDFSSISKTIPMIWMEELNTQLWDELKFINSTTEVSNDQKNATEMESGKFKRKLAMKNLLLTTLNLFGETTEDFVKGEIEDSLEFIDELEKIFKKSIFSMYYVLMTIDELNDLTNGSIDWSKLIKAKFREQTAFNNSDKINVGRPYVIKEVSELLDKTPRRVISNIITTREVLKKVLEIGIPDLDEVRTKYKIAKGENIKKISRWKFCLNWIDELYPLVLTRMYIKTFVDKRSKETVNEMIRLVQESYKKMINESDWLDDKTKERALSKADAIQRHVGYPNFILNDTEIEEEYSEIPTVKSTYFENVLETTSVIRKRMRDIIFGGTKGRWFQSPLKIDAFYKPDENSIWFPSGILQLPFFGENRMAAVNFGMIGSAIGHEIGHAFDVRGSNYNEKGEIEKWWAIGTDKLYQERTQCFTDQYSNYCPEDLQGGEHDPKTCVDGDFTVGENVADNTGIEAALNAYKLWVEKHGEEKRLPGLEEYTTEQLFFISFAYIWCENVPTDKWLTEYSWNPHAAGRYRVLGTLSNNEDFRKAFNCSVGKMNRGNQTCALW